MLRYSGLGRQGHVTAGFRRKRSSLPVVPAFPVRDISLFFFIKCLDKAERLRIHDFAHAHCDQHWSKRRKIGFSRFPGVEPRPTPDVTA